MSKEVKKILFASLVCGFVTACQSTGDNTPRPNDPFFAPIVPEIPVQKVSTDGSLFNQAMARDMYSDIRANRLGDIITVILRENTNATKTASSTLERETEVQIDPIIGPGADGLNLGTGAPFQLDLSATNDFEGDSQANQSNNLTGNISVTVIQVMPNGNLVVRGEKWITLNQGDEYIRLTGIVRPQDVNPANEILSTRIANARIQYSGTGNFARAQEQGWLGKFFNSKWWPF